VGLFRLTVTAIEVSSLLNGGQVFDWPGGAPAPWWAGAQSVSCTYVQQYYDPVAGVPVLPFAFLLPYRNVQEVLDHLVLTKEDRTAASVSVSGTYSLPGTVSYVGADTVAAAGIISVELPSTLAFGALDGRRVYIKDEGGGAGNPGRQINVYVNGLIGTIDGVVRNSGSPLVINTNLGSVTLVCRGESGGTSSWFIV